MFYFDISEASTCNLARIVFTSSFHLRIGTNKCSYLTSRNDMKIAITDNVHGKDGLGIWRRLSRFLLPLELWEGAKDEGEGGEENYPKAGPGKHLPIQQSVSLKIMRDTF